VKLEGGVDFAPTIQAIVKAGIPVQGHIGLTPQTASALGGFKAQGRNAESAYQIVEDAKALEAAGCFSIIVEAVPYKLAKIITEAVKIPVIGIGAGPDVDGQVLVTHDMLGLFDKFTPRFVKKYAELRPFILDALNNYRTEVLEGTFPGPEHSFTISDEALEQVKARLKD
jgi:3-methyl-2-oxobutanoate hydroxymethyltransferase